MSRLREPLFESKKLYRKYWIFVQKYESWMVEDWEQVFFSRWNDHSRFLWIRQLPKLLKKPGLLT